MNILGCDSVVSLNLLILNSNSTTQNIEKCDSYVWINGLTYTESNFTDYYLQYDVDSLCADTFYLNLTINSSSSSSDDVTVGDSFDWNGITYTESGVYTFKLLISLVVL